MEKCRGIDDVRGSNHAHIIWICIAICIVICYKTKADLKQMIAPYSGFHPKVKSSPSFG